MVKLINKYNLTSNPKNDVLSGTTVALALVPEAIAFAFVAGVAPLVGLYAAFIMALVTAVIGGRPGMISGATGALAVVMVSLVTQHGIEYLFAAVLLMGALQVLAGILSLGKFIRLVPHPVMLGFVNGLAIVIFLAQLGQFKSVATGNWMHGAELYLMLGLTLLTMGIIWAWPKVSKAIPAPLVAILTISGLVIGFGLETKTVGDLASVSGSLPSFHLPTVPLTLETFYIILPYSLILAGVGLIESLLTLSLIDEMTETRGNTAQECLGQGAGNLICGLFGAMGGCAMIGQSMININSGGKGRLSGITAGVMLLGFILFAGSYIAMIPLAALTGVMMMVVIGTFAWTSLRIINRIPKEDAFVILLVTAITVISDLAIAVICGVIVSALVFAWKKAHHIASTETLDSEGRKVYSLNGALFFGSITSFKSIFDPRNDPDEVIIDFQQARVWDHSALEAIDALAAKYKQLGKQLHLVHLSQDCKLLLKKAGDLVEVNVIEDPHYGLAVDYRKQTA